MTKKIGNHRWGPGGLAAARVFSQSLPNFEIEIFVKDYDIGGVWHYPEQKSDGRVMYDHLETNISKKLMQFSGFPFEENVLYIRLEETFGNT